MPDLSRFIPSIDLISHNAVALLIALIAVFALAELVVRLMLRLTSIIYSSKVLKSVTPEDWEAMRKRVRRRSLFVVSLAGLGLLLGTAAITIGGYRALDVFMAWWHNLGNTSMVTGIKAGAPVTVAIIVGALVASAVVRVVISGLNKPLAKSKWVNNHKETATEALQRILSALNALIFSGAALLLCETLSLPQGFRAATFSLIYLICGFRVARALATANNLLIDVSADFWNHVADSDGPLRYFHKLNHLAGLAKRTMECIIYVGATVWVAEQFSPNSWLGLAGKLSIRVMAIAYISRVVVEICILLLREIFLEKVDKKNQSALQQRQTLVPVAIGIIRYGIYFSALVMILSTLSIDPTPLLAGAGIVGVAIGLGAQAFVGDIVAGFFILFENLLLVGDIVEIGGVKGKVEEIGVRITKVRDDDTGVLYAIPNGEVRKVANHSKVFVNAVVDIYIPYEEDFQHVKELLTTRLEQALTEEKGDKPTMEIKLQELTEGSMIVRVQVKVPPGMDDEMGAMIRSSVIQELKGAKIGAPRPRRAVIIDSRLNVRSPEGTSGEDEEDAGPPQAFQAPGGSD